MSPAEHSLTDDIFRHIVESAREFAIFTIDLEGRAATWNAGAERLFGFRDEDIVGGTVDVLFTEEDRRRGVPAQEMRIALETGKAADVRWHVRKNGSTFWADGFLMPLKNEMGETRGFLKVVRDRTAEKKAEDALHDSDRRKNEFLAMLAHELRNPLAAIQNAVALAERGGEEEINWSLGVIRRQVKNFIHLIDDLLDVSRIGQGKIRLNKTAIALPDVVQEAIDSVKLLFEARNHQLTAIFSNDDLRIEADRPRLVQVLVNVLSNAAKYTPSSGRIVLRGRREADEVVVTIEDNGVGIPAEQLPYIFDTFVQVDRSLARSEGGLGIGLALVKSLVEMHGGRVGAYSRGQGMGSEFVIRLPSAAESVKEESSIDKS